MNNDDGIRTCQDMRQQLDELDRQAEAFRVSEVMRALYNRIMRCGSAADTEYLKQVNEQE